MTNAFTTADVFGGLPGDANIASEFAASAFASRMLAFAAALAIG